MSMQVTERYDTRFASVFAETVRIGIYARLSKNRNGISTNTAIQVAECLEEARHYASDRQLTPEIAVILEENDISASRYSIKERPDYEYLLELIRQNKVDVIFATETERLVRRPREMDKLIDLAETTTLRELYFTSDEGYNLSTPNGIYRARQAVNAAERESRKISERTKRKQAAKAREGKSNGGRRCFGYKPGNMELEPHEVAILHEFAKKLLGGQGFAEIAAWSDNQGYTNAGGKKWLPVTIRNSLMRKRYAGIREHNGAEYPAVWEPVFDAETWERLQLTLKLRRQEHGNVVRARKYLLTGVAYCGKCGLPMHGTKKKDRAYSKVRRVYVCMKRWDGSGCNGVARNADALDHYVTEQLLDRLDTPDLTKLLRRDSQDDNQLKLLIEARDTRKQKLDELVDDYASNLLTREQFQRAKTVAETELAKAEYEIATLNRKRTAHGLIPAGVSVRASWEASDSDDWKRAIMALAIERVDVFPTTSRKSYMIDGVRRLFDPAYVKITWREHLDLLSIAALINSGI